MTQLIGKWACTARILYWKPFVTPKTKKHFNVLLILFTAFRLTFDHVFDVGADGTHGGDFLLGSEPLLDEDLLAVDHSQVHGEMTEISGELASGAANRHDASVHFAGDALGNLNILVAVDGSHLDSERDKNRKLFTQIEFMLGG